jgi:hypothetical protein
MNGELTFDDEYLHQKAAKFFEAGKLGRQNIRKGLPCKMEALGLRGPGHRQRGGSLALTHFSTTKMWRFTWVRTPLSNGVRVTSVPTGLRYYRYIDGQSYRCQRIRNPRKYIPAADETL